MGIMERFKGVGEDPELKNKCNCACYTSGRDQAANHQRDHSPTCKCKKQEGADSGDERKAQSNQDSVYDDNNGNGCLLLKDW